MADFGSLHDARPDIDFGSAYDWDARERSVEAGNTIAHFGDLTSAAIAFIEASPAVIGCVAWLTELRILSALRNRPVALIVQKEDFLRPDAFAVSNWKQRLRTAYGALSGGFDRFEFPAPLSSASVATDPSIEAVRCVGNHNSERLPAMPRMHHKFLVRVERDTTSRSWEPVRPLAVWTGSFNFSANGGRSFENAVEIHDPEIAAGYVAEFARVATLSEQLDWTSDWVDAEWRIGT